MKEALKGALLTYRYLMERGAYFEAHEVLEEAWHPLRLRKDPLANLLKGLINAAVALEHLKRGGENAERKAQRVLCAYERHLPLCQEGIRYYREFRAACHTVAQLKIKYGLSCVSCVKPSP